LLCCPERSFSLLVRPLSVVEWFKLSLSLTGGQGVKIGQEVGKNGGDEDGGQLDAEQEQRGPRQPRYRGVRVGFKGQQPRRQRQAPRQGGTSGRERREEGPRQGAEAGEEQQQGQGEAGAARPVSGVVVVGCCVAGRARVPQASATSFAHHREGRERR
jgi:hypothetical protein